MCKIGKLYYIMVYITPLPMHIIVTQLNESGTYWGGAQSATPKLTPARTFDSIT